MSEDMFRYIFSLFSFLILLNAQSLLAQQEPRHHQLELSLAAAKDVASGSLAYQRAFGVAIKKKLRIGLGLRSTVFRGNDQELVTAPASLTTGAQGPQVIFLANKPENLDTLQIKNSAVTYVNMMFVVEYQLSDRFEAGFNIDLAGLSLGKQRQVTYHSSRNISGEFPTQLNASPTPHNLLLISHNDIGSLNSEIYLRYQMNDHWLVKLAYSYQFIEYTTKQKLRLGNDRFRQTPGLLALGLAWRFNHFFLTYATSTIHFSNFRSTPDCFAAA